MTDSVIGIDIGGTNFRMGIVSMDGLLIDSKVASSAVLMKENPMDVLAEYISAYIAEFASVTEIKAIAVGLPSIVSKDKKIVYQTPNLKGWPDNCHVKDILEEKLHLPVFPDRDVNFLLKNDMMQLKLDKNATVLGFYLGTGFGHSIYIEGRFYNGRNGVAGELGHIPLYGVKDYCTCGNPGCLETRCSGRYLTILAKEHFPQTDINEIFTKHGDHPVIVEFVENLAVPIATQINLLDPDENIIAGGVVAMKDFPKEIMEKSLKQWIRRPYPFENVTWQYPAHTNTSGIIGGAYMAMELLEQKNS